MCVNAGVYVLWCACRGQRTTSGLRWSLSTAPGRLAHGIPDSLLSLPPITLQELGLLIFMLCYGLLCEVRGFEPGSSAHNYILLSISWFFWKEIISIKFHSLKIVLFDWPWMNTLTSIYIPDLMNAQTNLHFLVTQSAYFLSSTELKQYLLICFMSQMFPLGIY